MSHRGGFLGGGFDNIIWIILILLLFSIFIDD